MRTIIIFSDLPRHVEFRPADFPYLPVNGVPISFDKMTLNVPNPKTQKIEKYEVFGQYKIIHLQLKYSTSRADNQGLTQYLELTPIED